MLELLIVAGVAGAAVAVAGAARRRALRRARARAEAVLDELAAAVCAAMAGGDDPSTGRRGARALARYERAGARIAEARTRRELEVLVARHRLRTGAMRMATGALTRARDLLAGTAPVRR